MNQKQRIQQILSLDLPPNVTLPLMEDGIYWKRMCDAKSWLIHDRWLYLDSFKSLFVHKTVQDIIENFNPDENDIAQLCETLKTFSEYETSLRIRTLVKGTEKEICNDLSTEDFDEQLDEIINMPEKQIYIDFEKLLGCFKHLQELVLILSPRYLDHDKFHFNNTDFNCLFRGLKKLKSLRKLRISNAILSNKQLITSLKALLVHECLTELNLSYNFVDNNVCDYIGKLLISSCPLESLVLKYNKVSDEGARSIAAALTINSTLRKLDLSLNMIRDDGGCFLARALLLNKTLTEIDVSKNKLSAEAGFAFGRFVEESNNLKSLRIQENFLGEVNIIY